MAGGGVTDNDGRDAGMGRQSQTHLDDVGENDDEVRSRRSR